MTDRDRIAKHLRRHGQVSPLDFDGTRPVVDGGKPIKRVAARIGELRSEGWDIDTARKDGMALYELVHARPVVLRDALGENEVRNGSPESRETVAQDPSEALGLFVLDEPVRKVRPAILDEEAAA